MRHLRIIALFTVILVSAAFIHSCNVFKEISNTLANISKLQFQIQNVTGLRVAGIDVANKSRISDFSLTDGLKLTNAFATKSFPANFILNLGALNPNDGKEPGTKQTSATITSLDYRLIIDDVPTITGDIDAPVTVPGSGQTTIIPLRMSLDLYQFFGNKGYEGIANLALALGGANKSPARVKLDIKPTVNTSIGPIGYPGRITVIDKEWR
jgi:hypothetical protein